MNKLFITIILLLSGIAAIAQTTEKIEVSGTVVDPNGQSLVGVTIFVKNEPGIGTATDADGHFKITVNQYSTLIFSSIGYEKLEKTITNNTPLKITLKEESADLDEVVVVGYGEQRKVSVIGAVTSINPKELSVPSNSVTNMLGGKIPGIIAVTRSGEPGKDNSEFWVRGISTFGANQSALILIDGIEGDLNSIDPSDIESFTVLKDASATAVYGMRGANGVVVVTTKRGTQGKLNINLKTSGTLSYSPRMPEYVDAYTYGLLANEARLVRDLPQMYDNVELKILRDNMDPDLYPNVDWQDEVLKKVTWNQQNYLSASGGGGVAQYFLSAGMQSKSAIFNSDNMHKYNTDQKWRMYTWRANIDANLTKTTRLSLTVDGSLQKFNYPGYGNNSEAVWSAIANLTPGTVPLKYSNGAYPGYGQSNDQISPYVVLNETGFRSEETARNKMSISLNQDLSFITQGLSISALYSYSNMAYSAVNRYKMPALYHAIGRKTTGELLLEETKSEELIGFSKSSNQDRSYYFETRANYNRSFGEHRVGGLLNFYLDDYQDSQSEGNLNSIAKRHMAMALRFTYSYKDTYMAEFNGGYTGSENFKPGEQFGFFPSFGIGWVPTQYSVIKNALPWVNFFKVRASYGLVGNDQLYGRRFPYFTNVSGVGGKWGSGAIGETQVGVDDLHWEVAKKFNLGFDMRFFSDRLNITVDYFKDYRDRIYQERWSMPGEVGSVQPPFSNVGKVSNRGIDGVISWQQAIGKEMYLTIRGNFTYARNNAERWEQTDPRYSYQDNNNKPLNVQRGLIAQGLFRDSLDIVSSPYQTYGEVRPGDIKYKDVNGDGKIDDDDIVPLSYSSVPEIMYGFAAEFTWRKWTLNVWFKGASKTEYFLGGKGYYPFSGGQEGNVLTQVASQSNRWTPAWYSGDPSTENPNARYPRLSYGNNNNNNRASTFWLANGRYLKLQNIQVSYALELEALKRIGLSRCDITAIGENLASWDKVKLWDPEQASSNGAVYPLQRRFTLQLNLVF